VALSEINELVTPAEAAAMVTLSVREIYAKEKAGNFPKSVDLSNRKKAFVKSEVQAWIDKMIEGRT